MAAVSASHLVPCLHLCSQAAAANLTANHSHALLVAIQYDYPHTASSVLFHVHPSNDRKFVGPSIRNGPAHPDTVNSVGWGNEKICPARKGFYVLRFALGLYHRVKFASIR
jgi:hypothetical protein